MFVCSCLYKCSHVRLVSSLETSQEQSNETFVPLPGRLRRVDIAVCQGRRCRQVRVQPPDREQPRPQLRCLRQQRGHHQRQRPGWHRQQLTNRQVSWPLSCAPRVHDHLPPVSHKESGGFWFLRLIIAYLASFFVKVTYFSVNVRLCTSSLKYVTFPRISSTRSTASIRTVVFSFLTLLSFHFLYTAQ